MNPTAFVVTAAWIMAKQITRDSDDNRTFLVIGLERTSECLKHEMQIQITANITKTLNLTYPKLKYKFFCNIFVFRENIVFG